MQTRAPETLEQRVNTHALAQRFKAIDESLTDSGSGERLIVPGLSIELARERFSVTSARDRDD